MRGSRIAGPLQAPRSWVSAGILAAVLAGVVASTGETTPAAPAAAAAPAPVLVQYIAVDEVAPQPVEVELTTPAAPQVKPAAVRRVTRSRPAAPARPAVAARPATPLSSDCTGAGWQQRRGEKALASLRHGVPAGVSISFLPGRGALKGITFYDRHAVEVYVGSCASMSDKLLRHVVAHELGHAWDSLHMTPELRAEFMKARGIPASTPWFGCSYCQDFATPAGDFAETYAQWQRGVTTSRSQMARPATPAELSALSRFFR